MKYQALLDVLEDICPFDLAEDWDNSGPQLDLGKEEIGSVLVCLDVTPSVVEEAIQEGVDLILSHHPLFFEGPKSFSETVPGDKKILDLIREDIGVVSCHTNFDIARGGNNDYLADLLGIQTDPFTVPAPYICGTLPEPMTLRELFLHTADALGLAKGQIRAGGDPDLQITRAAICTGGGSDFLEDARLSGCQVLITGDVKHHVALEAAEKGMAIIDGGHYGTEKIFVENMAAQLRERCEDLTVLETSINTDPFMV